MYGDHSCMMWVAQQRLITRLRRLRDHHRATVIVALRGKTRGHVVAQRSLSFAQGLLPIFEKRRKQIS